MQGTNSESDPEIVAQIQLLKAFLHQKANLNHDISNIKIKKNYIQSNNEYRDLKDLLALGKVLAKRLNEIRQINRSIRLNPKGSPLKHSSPTDLFSILRNTSSCLEIPRQIFSLNFEIENNLDLLKERFESISQEYDEKVDLYKSNECALDTEIENSGILDNLENEVNKYQSQLDLVRRKNNLIETNKSKKVLFRKESLKSMKNYNKLSENALKLRSKRLLQKELNHSIRATELELEDLSQKVAISQERVYSLKLDQDDLLRSSPKQSLELTELEIKIQKLQSKLEALDTEKSSLMSILSNENYSKDENIEEEDTLNQPSWTLGFQQMLKDKEELVAENQKLKDRISRLIN